MLSIIAVTGTEIADALGTCRGPASLRRQIAGSCSPDVVVVDVTDQFAPEIIATLTDAIPDARVLVVGPAPSGSVGLACLRAGAEGVLSRDEVRDGLYVALGQLGEGRSVLGASATAAVLEAVRRAPNGPTPVPLTPAQERILDMMATGATNRAIADRLGLSEKTVKNYATTIYSTLGAANRTEAVAIWSRLRDTVPG